MRKPWEKYLDNLTQTERNTILYNAIEHLLDMDEIRFQADDIVDKYGNPIPEEMSIDEFLYWVPSGEDLLKT